MRFLWNFALQVIVTAIALYIALTYVPGLSLRSSYGEPWQTYVVAALAWSLVQSVLGPLLRTLGLPFTILSLGLFSVIINALLLFLSLVALQMVGVGISIQTWASAILGLAVLSAVTWVLSIITRPLRA
ncbi:phage holin family protein [Corynebacterium uropygiale]|uniref:Phage holin family protein n=1 Tax=Corynebacterium uropygiale TaxID=1775911 RepID=A0A9X1QPW3_9CORY|nr:phage holin family protein [Corynebacterium uropygiale]MCF4005648.1 phage holin family protein [Corynebacterium uropygiale]